jgi:hypothetical protein
LRVSWRKDLSTRRPFCHCLWKSRSTASKTWSGSKPRRALHGTLGTLSPWNDPSPWSRCRCLGDRQLRHRRVQPKTAAPVDRDSAIRNSIPNHGGRKSCDPSDFHEHVR